MLFHPAWNTGSCFPSCWESCFPFPSCSEFHLAGITGLAVYPDGNNCMPDFHFCREFHPAGNTGWRRILSCWEYLRCLYTLLGIWPCFPSSKDYFRCLSILLGILPRLSFLLDYWFAPSCREKLAVLSILLLGMLALLFHPGGNTRHAFPSC